MILKDVLRLLVLLAPIQAFKTETTKAASPTTKTALETINETSVFLITKSIPTNEGEERNISLATTEINLKPVEPICNKTNLKPVEPICNKTHVKTLEKNNNETTAVGYPPKSSILTFLISVLVFISLGLIATLKSRRGNKESKSLPKEEMNVKPKNEPTSQFRKKENGRKEKENARKLRMKTPNPKVITGGNKPYKPKELKTSVISPKKQQLDKSKRITV